MSGDKLIDVEIKQTTLVRAKPEEVYDAIASADGINAWFTVGSEIDARPGGSLTLRWRDWGPDKYNTDSPGKVLEAKRGERFVFTWSSDKPDYVTTIEIDFEPVEEGTIVRLREHGYHDTPSGRAALLECAAGWGEALTLMKYYVEHGVTY
jgi:uncharacterized protein YndB with AHSA1/START domain